MAASSCLRGTAIARPLEVFTGAHIDYGAVDFGGGQLRDIFVEPDGVAAAPIVFLIQGFSCATIEFPAYHRLGEELVRRGIGFYRVEKPAWATAKAARHARRSIMPRSSTPFAPLIAT